MRKLATSVVIALLAVAPGAAFAATTVAPVPKPAAAATIGQSISGTVKAFDAKAHTLTLADGKVYHLPVNFRDPGLKAGAKVTVQWKMDGANYDATSVSLG